MDGSRHLKKWIAAFALGVFCAGLSACSKATTSTVTTCPGDPGGTSWVPNVSSASSLNHDSTTTLSTQVITATGPLTGWAQAAPASREVEVSFTIGDLGEHGSISLVAEVTGMPLNGGGYPLLVYLSDPNSKEYINLARSSTTGSCWDAGYFNSSGYPTSGCTIAWPSAYTDRTHWEQHQFPSGGLGYASVNTFPTCNRGGMSGTNGLGNEYCAFNSESWLTGTPARLPAGTYTAKYVLMASNYPGPISGYNATLKLSVIQKTDSNLGGAVDVNVILVGSKNIAASRTDKGKQNLDTLMEGVADIYDTQNSVTTAVKLGSVNVYEWSCENGGDSYATLSDVGGMFAAGSALVSSASEKKAINLFLVSSISGGSGLTILGLAGGIGGPMFNGLGNSGLTFSTFDRLDTYNPNCTSSSCPITSQEADFADLSGTIAHEMGHYLGLNHPSERGDASSTSGHDVAYDTPICTATQSVGGKNYRTLGACLNSDTHAYGPTGLKCSQACTTYNSSTGVFCPSAKECQFNHVMWWTSKNFKEGAGTGDGNLFSEDSGKIINYNPFIQ